MATTADCLARIRDLLGEETADLYTDVELLAAFNDGKTQMLSAFDVLLKTTTQTLTAGDATYALADLGRMLWLKHRKGTAGAYTYTELTPVSSDDITSLLELTGTDPLYYTTDIADASGATQITLYPTPGTGVTGSLYGMYFSVAADCDTTSVNPTWHVNFHFLPCYHAAAVMLRKDRRPEAALEMETLFKAGCVEYERWYNSRRPHGQDVMHVQPSPNDSLSVTPAYPYEIG